MTKWISRASVMRIIDADPVYSDVINEKTYMASQISNLPTKKETSRPHGEWETEPHSRIIHCSNCGATENMIKIHIAKWCYSCGAKMGR